MSELQAGREIPALARYNREAVDEIVRCVDEGIYCAVLGPRLSGKTVLLRYVARTLAESWRWTCTYLDLYDVQASTLQSFFAELIRLTAAGIEEQTGQSLPVPEPHLAGSAVFRAFLSDSVQQLGTDLVLIIEHLEAVPTDLVQALLTSLRAAFMDQQPQDFRVTVVVSGALSLATLTVGESSPFRGIARRVFVGDLSPDQSQSLIAEQLGAQEVNTSQKARRRLLRATRGDPFLIRQLCRQGVELAQATTSRRLRASSVKQITRQFLRDDVYQYAPLQEAIRLIEEDPDLLRCILLLLAHGTVPKAALPLPLSPDLDPLFLTGVVEQVGQDSYRVQNRIYRRFLTRHFHPGHVGHLLAMAGRWDAAIDYLEAGINEGQAESRMDLLPATINSMYAAEDIGQAAHFLTRGLSAGFAVVDARVWLSPSPENTLRLVAHLGPKANGALWSSPAIPLDADRLEARAYRQVQTLRGPEGDRYIWRAIPLQVPGSKPIGVVTVCDDLLGKHFCEPRERDLQLTGYLHQAARALQAVSKRRQELALAGRMQSSLLPGTPPELAGWQLAAALRPARETSGDFYDFIPLPGGRLGIVVADVADKGMGAALYMALSRTLIRTYAADHPNRPDLTLRAANERILSDTQAGLFVTVFYGILDPDTGTLNYCNAGHHPPYLMKTNNGAPAQELPGRGIALGVVEDTGWGRTEIPLEPGSALLLYTDGAVDAHNAEQETFGRERILDVVETALDQSAEQMQDALLTGIHEFMSDEPQFDDITLMVVKRSD